MKLKEIPNNTVVHTPTEAEAKELLAILHENGYSITYTLREIKEVNGYEDEDICFCIHDDYLSHSTKEWYQKKHNILTLAEFKERYCEMTEQLTEKAEETSVIRQKPQPKFKVGDKAFFPNRDKPMLIHDITDGVAMSWWDDGGIRAAACLEDLKPYPEPEIKPTEDMETKEKESGEKGNNSGNSQLNLCELLKGHEGETFYTVAFGDVTLESINADCPSHPVRISHEVAGLWNITKDGRLHESTPIFLFPSRALYEQYPLDPYTAWMKWQEEQKKYLLEVKLHTYDASNFQEDFYFRTPADRDKCIEGIKAVIDKYSR